MFLPRLGRRFVLPMSLLSVLAAGQGAAQEPSEEDLLLSFGDEEFVSIATGRRQLISKAPSVATVITAKDIEEIGAVNLGISGPCPSTARRDPDAGPPEVRRLPMW